MNYVNYQATAKVLLGLAAVTLFVATGSPAAAAPRPLPVIPSSVEIVYYNEFTGGSPTLGAEALTGAAPYDNVGSLKDALNSGNFLGIADLEVLFKDASGNIEQYNFGTGAGLIETAPGGPLVPLSGITPNPHAGELLIDSADVKNPAIIDTYDLGVMLLDADGTVSTYYTTASTLYADYSYTALSGGGNLDGVTMSTLASNPNFVGTENAYIVGLNAAGTGLELYSTLTGAFVSAWSVTTPLFGGPLDGKTVKDAVQDTHGVSGITFVGIGETDLAFYDSVNKMMVYYNHANLINTWAGGAITTPNGNLTLGDFAGSLAAAIEGGRFLGVANSNLLFIDEVGQMQAYNGVTGVGAGIYPAQPLEGPQAGDMPDHADLIDTLDEGYAFLDQDGSTSVYLTATRSLYLGADQRWTMFTGGDLDGDAPSKENIIATEDLHFYALEDDGTLTAYSYLTGIEYPELWNWTTFSGGYLDGKTLEDAVSNNVSGATFLGIGADGIVFAVANEPGIEFIGSPIVTEGGATSTFSVRLLVPPTADVTVNLSVTTAEATISPTTLTFTTLNWSTPQTVTVTAVDDTVVDGSVAVPVGFTITSLDEGYAALISTSSIIVAVNDNDTAVGEEEDDDSKGSSSSGTKVGARKSKHTTPTKDGDVLGATTDADLDCKDVLKTYIRFGANNDTKDVTRLQTFLNAKEGEKLTVNGIYDEATLAAVHRYQKKYFDVIIAPWGSTETTGYVYKTTRAHINARICGAKECSFTTNYKKGDVGSEVSMIQAFLAELDYYSAKTYSDVFDADTELAVRSFQSEFAPSILWPLSLHTPTGYWYESSRSVANRIQGCKK
jgi:peptidoglycan hydrolase-like protein with peptidoglycan-binding domain